MPLAQPARAVARSEWRWVWLVTLLALSATVVPLIVGWRLTPSGKGFLWNNRLNAEDLYTYLAWMDQGARGHLLFVDRFTSEPQKPALFLPLFWIGGAAARVLHLPLIAVYHAMRIALGSLVLCLAYRWIAATWEDVATRRTAFLLVLLSSGLGWLARAWGLPSVDVGIPEAITFMTLYQSPIFLAGLALTLVLLTGITRASTEREGRHRILLAAASALLTWTHPYDQITVLVVGCVWGGLAFARARTWRPTAARLLVVVAGAAPAALQHAWVIKNQPIYRGWAAMVRGESPSPLGYVLGFGLLIPLAIAGVRRAWARREARDLLPIAWVAATAILVYLPLSFQRRLIQGVHLPLCMLATFGVTSLLDGSGGRRDRPVRGHGSLRKAVVAALVVLLSLSNVRMIADDIAAYRTGRAPHYLKTEYLDAFRWLRERTEPDDVVFSSLASGSFIPGIAGNTVFLGHWGLTLLADAKKGVVGRFFANSHTEAREEAFLRGIGARYLFFGDVERNLGPFDPEAKPYLRRVFDNTVVRIYQVGAEAGSAD